MEAYRGNKAAPKRSPTDVTDFSPNLTPASNQEKLIGKQVRTVGVPESKYVTGNQLKVGPNTQNTGKLGDSLQKYQKTVLPATQNPDGELDRSGRRVAQKAVTKETI